MIDAIVLNLATGLLFLLLGIAAAHIYHRKGTKELRALVNKLPLEITQALQADVRDRLNVDELNQLIHDKTFDEDAARAGDPLPYRACPRCGNDKLSGSTVDGPGDHVFFVKSCPECGWTEWSE